MTKSLKQNLLIIILHFPSEIIPGCSGNRMSAYPPLLSATILRASL